MYTGVHPYFKWHDNNNDEDHYIYGAIQYAEGTFQKHRIIPLDLSEFWECETNGTGVPSTDELAAKAREWIEAEGIGKPEIDLTLSYALIDQDVRLHDAISVYFPAMDISVKAKVTSYKYDVLAERCIEIEVGKTKPSLEFTLEDASRLKRGLISPKRIGSKSVTGSQIADHSVGSSNIGDGALHDWHIGDEEITARTIAEGAILSDNILDWGELSPPQWLLDTIEKAKKDGENPMWALKKGIYLVADDDREADDIATIMQKLGLISGIKTSHIRNSAIVTDKIDDLAVVTDKIDNNAIVTSKVLDEAITFGKMWEDFQTYYAKLILAMDIHTDKASVYKHLYANAISVKFLHLSADYNSNWYYSFDIHNHELTCDSNGNVKCGGAKIDGSAPGFNIADTKFYKDRMSAITLIPKQLFYEVDENGNTDYTSAFVKISNGIDLNTLVTGLDNSAAVAAGWTSGYEIGKSEGGNVDVSWSGGSYDIWISDSGTRGGKTYITVQVSLTNGIQRGATLYL